MSFVTNFTDPPLADGAAARATSPSPAAGRAASTNATSWSWSTDPAAATTILGATKPRPWNDARWSRCAPATTSARPMIARPSGCDPKTASPATSNTLSWGSSSYIAISSSTTSFSGSSSPHVGRQTMSPSTSIARSRWRSSTRENTDVLSLPVAAFTSAPIVSKIWSISTEANLSVPRKSMCSTRWARPACSSDSTTEPPSIQKPTATDRTEGMASVTTRSPESSSVRRCRPSAT